MKSAVRVESDEVTRSAATRLMFLLLRSVERYCSRGSTSLALVEDEESFVGREASVSARMARVRDVVEALYDG